MSEQRYYKLETRSIEYRTWSNVTLTGIKVKNNVQRHFLIITGSNVIMGIVIDFTRQRVAAEGMQREI